MKPLEMKTKNNKIDLNSVYLQVGQLLLVKNPEQISFSLVARKTKVARTTLYYYFDSKIQSLMVEATRFVMDELMQIWNEPIDAPVHSWEDLQRIRFKKAVLRVQEKPWILEFYFRYCRHANFIGDEVRHIEQIYIKKSERDLQKMVPKKIKDRNKHLLFHLKLGILWGQMGPTNIWKNHEEELVELSSQLFTRLTHDTPSNR